MRPLCVSARIQPLIATLARGARGFEENRAFAFAWGGGGHEKTGRACVLLLHRRHGAGHGAGGAVGFANAASASQSTPRRK